MRTAPLLLVLAACSPAHPAGGGTTPAGTPPTAGVVTADPGGQVTVGADAVSVTLAGVKSVSSQPCHDDAAFRVQDGAGWRDVVQHVYAKMYVLDGAQVGPSMCDYSPCQTQVPGPDDVTLSVPLTGYEQIGEQDGWPAYRTVDLRGRIEVTFSYSTDECASYQTYTATIDRP